MTAAKNRKGLERRKRAKRTAKGLEGVEYTSEKNPFMAKGARKPRKKMSEEERIERAVARAQAKIFAEPRQRK